MPVRSERQRAAFEALRPQTMQHELDIFVDYALVGELFQHAKLGIEMTYGWSFYGPDDGLLYHGGKVTRTRAGTGIRIGSEWACLADTWKRVK